MATETLAPPLFPYATSSPGSDGSASVEPFGITTALPIGLTPDSTLSGMTLCPDQQIALTADGQPFVDTPSMESKIQTTTTTVEDMQTFTDNEGTDTD